MARPTVVLTGGRRRSRPTRQSGERTVCRRSCQRSFKVGSSSWTRGWIPWSGTYSHAQLKGEFGVKEVEAALRKHWTDSDLRRQEHEKGKFMNASMAEEEDALVGELDWDSKVKASRQKRTLKEQGRQHAVRMARQYCPVPAAPSPGLPRRDPFRPRPGDGRGGIKCLRCGGPQYVGEESARNRSRKRRPRSPSSWTGL